MLFMTPLTFRKNYSVNGAGVCWAATGASIINYKRGGTSFTTMDVYNALKTRYGTAPSGTLTWINRMWEHYKIAMTYINHRLKFTTILNKMEAHKPIFCCFDHYEGATSSKNYAHAVALCGCYYRTDLKRYYYIYMDPNHAADKVYVVNHIFPEYINGETSPFYYNPGDGTIYNNWRFSYY